MKTVEVQNVYLIGIGGIGMSALARWFHHQGATVAGYDKNSSAITKALVNENIAVLFDEAVTAMPNGFQEMSKDDLLVIYTPAVPSTHPQLAYFREAGYTCKKRSEVLGMITKDHFTVAVAGTHGKTTTTTMIAHLLKHSNKNCMAFLGGISTNYNTNLLLQDQNQDDAIVVVEADEYDKSFLRLFPNIAVITSLDPDHLDIYGDYERMKESYRLFAGQVNANGQILIQEQAKKDLNGYEAAAKRYYYGSAESPVRAKNIMVENGKFVFDYVDARHDITIARLAMAMPGLHNIENAIAAIAVCLELGLSQEQIREGITTFAGVKRRFEFHVSNERHVYIDDYAHHPKEIAVFLEAVRLLYPKKKITAIFQPHLFSRTRDLADGFAESLNLADEVWLMDIYPAREKPIPGVDEALIFDKIQVKKHRCNHENLLSTLDVSEHEVLVTIGAGDIEHEVQPLKALLDV